MAVKRSLSIRLVSAGELATVCMPVGVCWTDSRRELHALTRRDRFS